MNFFAALARPEMEKRAMAAAARGAWSLARAPGVATAGRVGAGQMGYLGAGWQAAKAGYGAMNPAVKTWGGRIANGAMAAPIAYGAYDAITNERPYDQQQIQLEGYNAAQAGIQKRIAGMGALERHLIQMDPSLLAYGAEQAMPGTIAAWEQQSGQKVTPGPLSSMYQAWNSKGTPSYYSYDGAGGRNYL